MSTTTIISTATPIAAVAIAAAVPLSAYLRRPRLELSGIERENSGGVEPRVYISVRNRKRRRAAHAVSVEMARHRRHPAGEWQWGGNPALVWAGVYEPPSSVTVYAGATRYVQLGGLIARPPTGWRPTPGATSEEATTEFKAAHSWYFNLSLQSGGRELEPAKWVLELVVGATEGDAATYNVELDWEGAAEGPEAALASLTATLSTAHGLNRPRSGWRRRLVR